MGRSGRRQNQDSILRVAGVLEEERPIEAEDQARTVDSSQPDLVNFQPRSRRPIIEISTPGGCVILQAQASSPPLNLLSGISPASLPRLIPRPLPLASSFALRLSQTQHATILLASGRPLR